MANSPASPCPGCGRVVDPLRAGHVAIIAGKFHYFCGPTCKVEYRRTQSRPDPDEVATAQPPDVSYEERPTRSVPPPAHASPPLPACETARAAQVADVSHDEGLVAAAFGQPPPLSWRIPAPLVRRPQRALAALDGAGMVLGALVPAVELLGPVADVARLPLATAAWVALVARVVRGGRDPADPHPLVVLAPTGVAVAATAIAQVTRDPHAVGIAVFAGLACSVAIAVERLVFRARHRIQAARERIERALDVRVRVLRGDGIAELPASEVRPGEQIVVEAGEWVGVDAAVVAGEARVIPWLDAPLEVVRREGDPVVAGARVMSSRLRMITTWSGKERAWVKLLSVRSARIDVAAPTARALRHTVERGSPLAAVLAGVASFVANGTAVEVAAAMSAAAMAFAARAVPSFVGLHFARAHLAALASGITYKDARAFERAGATDVAVLNARGTVLLGEPEIVAVEPMNPGLRSGQTIAGTHDDASRVLSLAAGAETASTHPFAAAILRAARTRGVRPDPVRNATVHAGLGVTALASTGERLVVGGRAIMLEEKIGGAMADARVSELEALGRSVLLVALGDRLVGLIALQDGLRPGARTAVQRLLDAGIEPVLMSGEARETCETIGRALDIDHVRPEVLPAERGAEVRALGEGGAVVGVVGHAASDDGALGAADIAVAMGAAGSTPGEWAIALASDDVRDAADALAIPHATRARVFGAIILGASPGVVAMIAIGFGVAPVAAAPLALLVGAIAVAAHARESAPSATSRR